MPAPKLGVQKTSFVPKRNVKKNVETPKVLLGFVVVVVVVLIF